MLNETNPKENQWQKIKRNHFLMMALCCLAPILLFIAFLGWFGKVGDYWVWLLILLCPVLHFWMMKGHKHDGNHKHDEHDS